MTTETKRGVVQWFKNNIITIVLIIAGFTLTQIQADNKIEAKVETNKALYEKDVEYIKQSIQEIKTDIKEIKKELKEKRDK